MSFPKTCLEQLYVIEFSTELQNAEILPVTLLKKILPQIFSQQFWQFSDPLQKLFAVDSVFNVVSWR